MTFIPFIASNILFSANQRVNDDHLFRSIMIYELYKSIYMLECGFVGLFEEIEESQSIQKPEIRFCKDMVESAKKLHQGGIGKLLFPYTHAISTCSQHPLGGFKHLFL